MPATIPPSIRLIAALRRRLGRDALAMGACAKLAWFSFTEALTGFYWTISLALRVLRVGEGRVALHEMAANTRRQLRWAGSDYAPTYAVLPAKRSRADTSLPNVLADPAHARDIAWHLGAPFGVLLRGCLLASTPLCLYLTAHAVFAISQWGSGFYFFGWYTYVESNYLPVLLLVPLALLVTPTFARWDQRLHRRRVLRRLCGGEERLNRRVEELTATRRSALELQEQESRRIERDLHDGAQARIVAMGMTLTQVQRLLEVDPEGAKELLAAAKQDSSAALGELRSLVRGIRPPLLADRGLTAAIQSLAAGCPIDTRVVSRLDHRLVPTIETAIYFAVAELVTNAVKHSAASEIVIELGQVDDHLEAVVTDNGIGGVTETADGGLTGIRQRLAPFDGTLSGVSPVGGPTVVRIRVPLPLD